MKILVAPLNWGLGHATRCIPLIRRFIANGDEVSIGGDGESLLLLKHTFPTLRILRFAGLDIRYSQSDSQVWAMMKAAPKIAASSIKDHVMLKNLLKSEKFDMIVSDNRFGLFVSRHWRKKHNRKETKTIYLTHQLNIRLPRFWHKADPIATAIHRCIYKRFDEIWVPDYADEAKRLSGSLSCGGEKTGAKYIGPLSRLCPSDKTDKSYDVIAVLSGLEPQRTKIEKQLTERFKNADGTVLIVRGKIAEPMTSLHHNNITLIPHIDDNTLVACMQGAKHIIARSGYSTIMDLAALGLLHKAEFIPTEGQSEQEYLAEYMTAYTKRFTPSPTSAI